MNLLGNDIAEVVHLLTKKLGVDRADLYLVAAALGADDLFFAHGVFFFLFFSYSLCQRIVDSHFSSAMIIWAVAEVLPSAAVIFNAADFPARTTARLRP